MTGSSLSPNRLADLYDSLSIMLEALPVETHPAWELAIESVLFDGEGIAPETVPYGEQQANKNDFRMAAYRTRYGNGDRVTEFPTLSTEQPSGQDRQYVDEEIQLPVSPDSETVLPLFVDDKTLPEAVGLLNEFSTEPGEESTEASNANLLNLNLFPGLTTPALDQPTTGNGQWTEQLSTHQTDLSPNELADLYDGLYTLLESLPDDVNPHWQEAIESVLFGGAYLHSEASPYGEQQSDRNTFGMPDYRSKYGDGDRVAEFPTIATKRPAGDDAHYVDDGVELPIAPDTRTVLPLAPAEGELHDAARLLAEFPAAPDAEMVKHDAADTLFDIDGFLRDIDPGAHPDLNDSSADSQSESGTGYAETSGTDLESHDADATLGSDLSRQEQERLENIIELAPTSNGELASSWGLDETKEVWEYLTEHLDDYYYRNENSRIEPTEEGIRIGTQTDTTDSSTDSQLKWVMESDQDTSSSTTSTETRSEESQSAATTETESGTGKTTSASHTDTDTRNQGSQSASTTETKTHGDNTDSSSMDSTVLRQESAGESTEPLGQQSESTADRSRKYEDPRAEAAHRRAQQRDPSDVVELGGEIKLTLKQVDYSSHPPTIMGTKNRLVVFVIDAPQDLSEYDTIKATVVDYGGKNNSAEAAFSGYVD